MITKLILRSSIIVLIGLLWLLPSPAKAEDKRLVEVPISDAPSYAKRALVVGVNDYDVCPKLNVCNNDAKEFAELLKSKFGFSDVILMTDAPNTPGAMRPTQRNLKRALETLYGGLIPQKSEVVLFFSGHGVRAHDLGGNDADWLVPEDGDPHDIPNTCINYDAIKQRLDTLRPARVLLVTDACRSLLSGKAAGEGSGFGKGLAKGSFGPEVAELQSCQPTEISQEGLPNDFPESVFTHFLLKGLNGDPDAVDTGDLVTFDSLKQYLQGSVSNYVASRFGNASQVPDGRATLGRMVLARLSKPKATAPIVCGYLGLLPSDLPPTLQTKAGRKDGAWISAIKESSPGAKAGFQPEDIVTAFNGTPIHSALDLVKATVVVSPGSPATLEYLRHGQPGSITVTVGALKATPLTVPATIGNAAEVSRLLDQGADINATDEVGRTALMAAVSASNPEVVRVLLERGADLTPKTPKGQTAFSMAVAFGETQSARLLLAKGADVNIKEEDGATLLIDALSNNDNTMAKLLIDKTEDINAKSKAGWTALLLAILNGSSDTVRLLLEKGADANMKYSGDWTALMTSAQDGKTDIVRLLLDHGADIHAKQKDGWTALQFAKSGKHNEIVTMLKAAGATE